MHLLFNWTFTGLEINSNKCELTILNDPNPIQEQATVRRFREILPNIKLVSKEQSTLLGAQISRHGITAAVTDEHKGLQRMVPRLNQVYTHQALGVFSTVFLCLTFQYVLWASSAYMNAEALQQFDEMDYRDAVAQTATWSCGTARQCFQYIDSPAHLCWYDRAAI